MIGTPSPPPPSPSPSPSPAPSPSGGTVFYPSDLPGPWVAIITEGDRRAATEARGPLALRALQRDRLYTQQLEWVLKPEQAETFKSWYDVTLVFGASWYRALWPHPLGRTGLTERRFIETPTWTHIPGGNWRVAGVCEVREARALSVTIPSHIQPAEYGFFNHDWGVINSGYIYRGPQQAAEGAAAAYAAAWNRPLMLGPPDGRWPYRAIPRESGDFIVNGNTAGDPTFPPPYTYYVYHLRASPQETSFDVGAVLGRFIPEANYIPEGFVP